MEETTNVNPTPSTGGMNWKVISGVIAAVVVIGIVVFGMGGKTETPDTAETKGSLKSILAMGGSQKCTVSSKTETSESSGEVMVSNGMMRGTFTSTANGQTMTSNMIVKDNVSYMWTGTDKQGIKMAFDAAPTTGEAPQQGIDTDLEYGYDCDNWSEDASAFEVPADITFTDLAAMMQGANIPTDLTPEGTNQ
ncbi:MAG: hypothetical protein AAB787_00600 [Patescibacteria group bacterium]